MKYSVIKMDNQLIVISSQISPENYNKNNRERNKLQKLEHVLGGEGRQGVSQISKNG